MRDFPAIVPLLQQLWPDQRLDVERLLVVFSKRLRSPRQRTMCALVGERLVGFASMTLEDDLWVEGCLAHVDELVVAESARGQGIGSRLLDEMISLARQHGARRVELDSAHHRREAHAFYERLGFENRGLVFSKPLR